MLGDAIRFLADSCDRARDKDGAGFNKIDADRGHILASVPEEEWTPKQRYSAWQMLRKYRKQLAGRGIDYDAIPAPPVPDSERKIVGGETAFRFFFPYDENLILAVKKLPRAQFVKNGSAYWVVPASKDVIPCVSDFAEEHGFFFNESACDLIGKLEREEEIKPSNPCKIVEGTAGNFLVLFPYDSALVAGVKAIFGSRYQPTGRNWTIPPNKARELVEYGLKNGFDLGPLAKFDEKARKQREEEKARRKLLLANLDLDAPLPCGMVLFSHQKEAVMRTLENSRQIFALDMGTGKTIASLVAAKIYGEKLGTITYVVGPASLWENWMREAEMVETPIEYYSWAKVPEPPSVPYVMIGDESHAMQNLKAKRTQRGLALADKAESVMLLTGTPVRNGRPAGLYPLLKATKHVLADDRKKFEIHYCNAHATRFTKWDTTGAANLQELYEKTRDVMFRKTKLECLDLPKFMRVLRKAELSEEASESYNKTFTQLRSEYHRKLAEGTILSGGEALVMLGHLRHASSVAKTETAIELAEEVIEQGSQAILFVAFKDSGETISQSLKCELFSGDLDTKDRQPMIDRFQAGEKKAIVCTIGAGGVGLNMQAANTVIMVDRSWTLADAEQCESRAHRSGQTQPVTSVFLQANSTDEAIDALLLQKAERIELILHGKRKTMRGVSGEADMAQEVLMTLFN